MASAPAALQPPDGERALFKWNATGAQIYECRADGKGRFTWTFVAPEAELFNQDNDIVGTHGAGPFWAALDGSRTVGTVRASAEGASPADIPVLLLSARPGGGSGLMRSVTSVQRLNTRGGSAPLAGCRTESDAGKQARQPYIADYVFFAGSLAD